MAELKKPKASAEARRKSPKGRISDVFGALKRKSVKRLSLKRMKEIVETGAVERSG
jgi:hypothetical protein